MVPRRLTSWFLIDSQLSLNWQPTISDPLNSFCRKEIFTTIPNIPRLMTLHRPTLLLLCSLLLSLSALADDVRTFGRWKVTYVADGHTLKYNYQKDDGSYRPIFVRSVPEATYDNVNGVSRHVTILDFSSRQGTVRCSRG